MASSFVEPVDDGGEDAAIVKIERRTEMRTRGDEKTNGF